MLAPKVPLIPSGISSWNSLRKESLGSSLVKPAVKVAAGAREVPERAIELGTTVDEEDTATDQTIAAELLVSVTTEEEAWDAAGAPRATYPKPRNRVARMD